MLRRILNNEEERKAFEDRKKLSEKKRLEFKDKVPVIFTKNGKNTPELTKQNFLIPKDIEFFRVPDLTIRKHSTLKPENAIFLFIGRNTVPMSATVNEIDKKYRNKDGFLYIDYTIENTFGF